MHLVPLLSGTQESESSFELPDPDTPTPVVTQNQNDESDGDLPSINSTQDQTPNPRYALRERIQPIQKEPAPPPPPKRRRCTIIYERCALDYDPTIDYLALTDIGAMDKVCIFCGALRFANEPPGLCCSSGKIKIPLLQRPPQPLDDLFSGTHIDSRHFKANARIYNQSMAMTSFGATKEIQFNGFVPTVKVQGQVSKPGLESQFLSKCISKQS